MAAWGTTREKIAPSGAMGYGGISHCGGMRSVLNRPSQRSHAKRDDATIAEPLASPPTVRSEASVHGCCGGTKQAERIFKKRKKKEEKRRTRKKRITKTRLLHFCNKRVSINASVQNYFYRIPVMVSMCTRLLQNCCVGFV
jgi:hypothetical protein